MQSCQGTAARVIPKIGAPRQGNAIPSWSKVLGLESARTRGRIISPSVPLSQSKRLAVDPRPLPNGVPDKAVAGQPISFACAKHGTALTGRKSWIGYKRRAGRVHDDDCAAEILWVYAEGSKPFRHGRLRRSRTLAENIGVVGGVVHKVREGADSKRTRSVAAIVHAPDFFPSRVRRSRAVVQRLSRRCLSKPNFSPNY